MGKELYDLAENREAQPEEERMPKIPSRVRLVQQVQQVLIVEIFEICSPLVHCVILEFIALHITYSIDARQLQSGS